MLRLLREGRSFRALPGLSGECGLPARLFRAHLRDLALDRRQQAVLLRELRLDRLLLRGAILDDLRLTRARLLEVGAARLDFLAVALDRSEDLRVLARHPLDRVEPRDDVVEAARAEDHLERRVALPVDVQITKSLGDALPRDDEALLRGDQMLRVRREIVVDLLKLNVCVVVCLDRLLEVAVQAVDLGHDRLGLRALRRDRLARCRSNGKQKPGGACRSDNEYWRPSGSRASEDGPSALPDRPAGGGLARHKSETLAASPDACNRQLSQNICKEGTCRDIGTETVLRSPLRG